MHVHTYVENTTDANLKCIMAEQLCVLVHQYSVVLMQCAVCVHSKNDLLSMYSYVNVHMQETQKICRYMYMSICVYRAHT